MKPNGLEQLIMIGPNNIEQLLYEKFGEDKILKCKQIASRTREPIEYWLKLSDAEIELYFDIYTYTKKDQQYETK